MADILNSVIGGLREGSLYGLLALGIVLIYKSTGVLSLAQANIGMVVTMILYSLTATTLPYAAAIALSLAAAAALGLVAERLCVRPLLRAPATSGMIVTLALSGVLGVVAAQVWPGSSASPLIPPFDTASHELGGSGVYLAPLDVATVLVSALLAGLLRLFLRCTWMGLAMRATADRLGTAPLMGIRVGRVSAVSWVLGALLATVSGILHGSGLPALQSTFMLGSLVWAVLAAALGGLTSFPGALLAGLLIGMADQILQLSFGPLDLSPYHQSLVFILVVAVLLVRRRGLLGGPELRRAYRS